MKLTNLSIGLIVLNLLPACADQEEVRQQPGEKIAMNLDQFKWKNRVILTFPEDETSWAKQQELYQQQKGQIEDRDLVIIEMDSKQRGAFKFSKAERLAIIKKYEVTPGSHVLIGKDGGEKRRQAGKLDIKQFFQLIDQMPMRRAEMQSPED